MEILRLCVPLISIAFGMILKSSNSYELKPLKKYWLFLIIAGSVLFILRLYAFLNN